MAIKNSKEANDIIDTLNSGNFYCECPCGCGEEIKLKDTDLFYLDNFTSSGKEAQKKLVDHLKQQRFDLKEREKNMSTKPQITAKAVNIGFILERIAPTFKTFRFEHNDCRSLFDPIDYVIFEGLHKKGKVEKIIFTDIKTSAARLKPNQKEVKNLIVNKKLEFKFYKNDK
jgi:predicted Holliday junction resolvase-like endonuclease